MLQERWHIELLGGLRARQGDVTVTRFRTQKTAALLGFLAFNIGNAQPRETVAEMFWPDRDKETGRLNLRVAVAALRRQLEPPGVRSGSVLVGDYHTLTLNAGAAETDAATFLRNAAAGRSAAGPDERFTHLQAAAAAYHGPLLPGFYQDWVLEERHRLADVFAAVLQDLVELSLMRGDPSLALDFAHTAAALDPLDEAPVRALIQIYAAAGMQAQATEQLQIFTRRMQHELGAEPSEGLRAALQTPVQPGLRRPRLRSEPRRSGTPVGDKALSDAAQGAQHPENENRLPIPLDRFFDRYNELDHIERLLNPDSGVRLVTLTGPGGTGKTRLAVEAGRVWHAAGRGPVWFASLAEVDTARGACMLINRSLGIERDDDDPIGAAAERIGGRATLLVLDNLEQIADGCGFAVDLLKRTTGLKLLVTSRHSLKVEGESELAVPPLPAPEMASTPERLVDFASVQLFADRAQAIRAEFQVTPANAAAVGELCRELEGMPLSIELAAGWIQALTPGQMLQRMHKRFELLVSLRKDIDPRHMTLLATMDWSYNLLPAGLQRSLRMLSVFRGSFTIDGLAAVCGCPVADAPRLVAELQSRSMITTSDAAGDMRARMLEALREYAEEKLSPEERTEAIRLHSEYTMHMARAAAESQDGAARAGWLNRLTSERSNIRIAMTACLLPDAGAAMHNTGLELAGWLWRWWFRVMRTSEMGEWLIAALQLTSRDATAERARALTGAAAFAWERRDYAEAEVLATQALEMCTKLGLRQGEADALNVMGIIAMRLGNAAGARELSQRALDIRREGGSLIDIATSINNMAVLANDAFDLATARSLYSEAKELQTRAADTTGICLSLMNIGAIDLAEGHLVRSMHMYAEALGLARSAHLTVEVANACKGCAECNIELGDYARAESMLTESLLIFRDLGDTYGCGLTLLHFGTAALLSGRIDEAHEYADQSARLLTSLQSEGDAAYALSLQALIHSRLGNHDLAGGLVRQAARTAAQVQQYGALAHALDIHAAVTRRNGAHAADVQTQRACACWRLETHCVPGRLVASASAGRHIAAVPSNTSGCPPHGRAVAELIAAAADLIAD